MSQPPASPMPASTQPSEDRLPFSPAAGCVLAGFVGLLCAGVFFLALGFNQRGEITYAPEPFRGARLWIVRGDDGRGLGLSMTHPLPGDTLSHVCAETSVRFLLTGKDAAQTSVLYCECFERVGESWSGAGTCPE